jgi:AcrR family transcriptional regulator
VDSISKRQFDRNSPAEQQILAATESLLGDVSARDLSVQMILDAAGVARGTFYHYFDSKWSVVNALAARMLESIFVPVSGFIEGGTLAPEDMLERAVVDGSRVWGEHRAVARAVLEHWREVPELRAMWLTLMEQFIGGLTETIEQERAAGRMLPGPPARQLVTVLVWAGAQSLYLAGLPEITDLPDETAAAQCLKTLWTSILFGSPAARQLHGAAESAHG